MRNVFESFYPHFLNPVTAFNPGLPNGCPRMRRRQLNVPSEGLLTSARPLVDDYFQGNGHEHRTGQGQPSGAPGHVPGCSSRGRVCWEVLGWRGGGEGLGLPPTHLPTVGSVPVNMATMAAT